MKEMRVLVLEPEVSGHRGPYLEWMIQGLVEHGFNVTLITLPESLKDPSLQGLVRAAEADCGKSIRLISCNSSAVPQRRGRVLGGGVSLLIRELAYRRQFAAWYKTNINIVRPDVVLLPYLDYCLYAIGLLGSPFGSCPWVGVSMRPSFHYQEMGIIAPRPRLGTLKKWLFFRVLNNRYLNCLLTLDEPLVGYLNGKQKTIGRFAFLPEPVGLITLPRAEESKRLLGTSPERKLILVYGSITHRKGVTELLRAVADPSFPPSVDVFLAGKISCEVDRLLLEPWVAQLISEGRLKVVDRFFESSDEPLLFSAADMVWLGYREHYAASGVLVQAAQAGRPVLACKEGIIGWQTSRYGLGLIIEPREVSSVISAVATLVELPKDVSAPCHREKRSLIGGTFPIVKNILARAMQYKDK